MVFEEMYNVMIIFTKTYIGKTDLAPYWASERRRPHVQHIETML